MRDKASPGTWLSWLTVSAGGAVMVGAFALAGGVGGGQRGVASAIAANTSSSSSSAVGANPTISGLSTPSCVSDTLTGGINVPVKFTGSLTLGLFAISDPESPLVRSFTDTGQRVTVTFNGVYHGSFTFSSIPGGPAGYLVAVLPPSGMIDSSTQLVESQVVPSCNTTTTTLTATATSTTTTSTVVTFTLLHYVTVTDNVVNTVTQTTDTCVNTDAIDPISNAKHPTASGAKPQPAGQFNLCQT